MKKYYSFAIYAMAALAMALAMGSCKKNDQNTKSINNGQAVSHFDPRHISDMNAYLGDFKQKMKQSQYAKDGETLPLEEAAWHLSSVANYDFANANVEFTDLRYDTLYYQVNVTNGEVALSDINAVYADMADDIDEYYQNLDLEEKHFRFIGTSVSEDGQVRVELVISYIILDHTWYFGDDWDAALFCMEWFDDNTYYVWNTTAAHLLARAINFLEGREYSIPELPPGRSFYVYTTEVIFRHDEYYDQYGSPFASDSRLFRIDTDWQDTPLLGLNEMCYCVDSYTNLPFRYIQEHVGLEGQRPVNWTIVPYSYKKPGVPRDYTFCHDIKVKFGIRIINENPIQY